MVYVGLLYAVVAVYAIGYVVAESVMKILDPEQECGDRGFVTAYWFFAWRPLLVGVVTIITQYLHLAQVVVSIRFYGLIIKLHFLDRWIEISPPDEKPDHLAFYWVTSRKRIPIHFGFSRLSLKEKVDRASEVTQKLTEPLYRLTNPRKYR